MFLRDI